MTFLGQVRSGARVALLLLCAVTIEWAAPPPALAWFGWLDKFSGPGDFKGGEVEIRLLCFGEVSPVPDLRKKLAHARLLTERWRLLSESNPENERRAAYLAWGEVGLAVDDIDRAFVDIRPKLLVDSRALVTEKLDALRAGKSASLPEPRPSVKSVPPDASKTTLSDNAALERLKELAEALEAVQRGATSASVTRNTQGVLWATCTPDKLRRWSTEINLGGFVSKGDQPLVAGGEQVRLVTVMPSVTYRLFDMVDIGAGVGGYWFSSRAFETFGGMIASPLRLTLHAPSRWYGRRGVGWRVVTALEARGGFLLVPRGFGARIFDPAAESGRIPAEFVKWAGVSVNLNALFGAR